MCNFNNKFVFLFLKSTSDLTIIVEKQSIYVHKAILKIRSTYFRSMLQTNYVENKERYIFTKKNILKKKLFLFDLFVIFQY